LEVCRHEEIAMSALTSYHEVLGNFAIIKRFNERWVADPGFRDAMSGDAVATLARYGIDCRPEDVRPPTKADLSDASLSTHAMWQIVRAKSRLMHELYRDEATPSDPRVYAWREREIARQMLDLGPFHTRSNIHSSLSFELTKGCSVGCWFCALSPDRLSAVFRHDDANGALWRGVLGVFRDALGGAMKSGFLYWGSDPLDNPDYEKFCLDFHEVAGIFPPTTTALPLKNPARTRALLRMSEERGCWLNRFSVITLKMLDAVHREFGAEELARVECLAVNRESAFAFGNAGRFRDHAKEEPALLDRQFKNLQWAPWYTADPAYAGTEDYPLASIGCVTGFLVNMCDRNVKLISPCTADDRIPLGYFVYEEGTFDTADDLRALVEGMIERRMSPHVGRAMRPAFHDWLTYEELENGFRLHGRFHGTATFRDDQIGPAWRATGDLVRGGASTAEEIVERVTSQTGAAAALVERQLEGLRQSGVLDELQL
jgi:radical SAM family RiPP maturation amino acid epimerase